MTNEITEAELFDAFKEQAEALAEGGADALVVETMTDLVEAAAGVRAAKTTGLPVAVSLTYDSGKDHTRTIMGVGPEKAAQVLSEAGADIIGCNCGIGIDNYIKVAALLRSATDKPIWVKANAGLPQVEGDKVVYRMSPQEFAEKAKELVTAGANIVGGCCGTSPAFIQALSATLH
jgi:5-methyltetrahydrofolate--homocysteine methyltransferase